MTNIWLLHKDNEIQELVIKLGMLMMVMVVIQNINVLSKYGSDSDITFFTVVNRFYLSLCMRMFGLMRVL